MATTQEQIDALKAAIGQGARTVRFADGRSLEYRSVDDQLKALAALEADLAAATDTPVVRRIQMTTDRGL